MIVLDEGWGSFAKANTKTKGNILRPYLFGWKKGCPVR